jgi:hypothetical protein
MENDNEPEVIRQRMEETRTALTEKLERLEGQVTGMVGVTAEAVTETVENVKETFADVTDAVQEKVQTVKEMFDFRLQMERHPFLLIGGSVALGFIASRLLKSVGQTASAAGHAVSAVGHAALAAAPVVNSMMSGPSSAPAKPEPNPKAAKAEGESFVGEALGQVKNLAVGSVMAMLREMATAHLPNEFGKQVAETVDGLTQKLGVQPMASPIDLQGDNKAEASESQEELAKAGKPGRNRKAAASRN